MTRPDAQRPDPTRPPNNTVVPTRPDPTPATTPDPTRPDPRPGTTLLFLDPPGKLRMDAETRPTRLRIGPDSVYAAYVVAGVTYTHAAPTVSLMPFNALELAMLEIDAETLVAGNNTVVPTPARDVRFVAERGWVDFTAPAEVVRERDPASPAEFAYRVFDALGADGVAFASRGGWLALDFAAPTNTVVRKTRVSRPRRARALCGV